jgi:16S rRNA (adenine1518-N6/adenine1519-N6)-dimethyltransferase
VKVLKKLPPNVFWPRPQVNSAIVRLEPYPVRQAKVADREFFHDYVRGVFLHRRKLLRGVLRGMYGAGSTTIHVDQALAVLDVSATSRAEELDVAAHVELSNTIWRALHTEEPATV